jgi:hypothetical protein
VKRHLAIALLPLLLVLSACAERGTGGDSDDLGTIRGTVLAGPTCPVERAESPCPDHPVGGVRVQALQSGSVSAEAISDEDGSFRMELAAGAYLLQTVVEPEGPGMYSKPMRVQVPAGGAVEATVLLDTGIRAPVGGGR